MHTRREALMLMAGTPLMTLKEAKDAEKQTEHTVQVIRNTLRLKLRSVTAALDYHYEMFELRLSETDSFTFNSIRMSLDDAKVLAQWILSLE